MLRKFLKILRYPFWWLWYYIFDPRGLKPSEISQNMIKGQDAIYSAHAKTADKVVEMKAKRKRKKKK